jgi:hypothetical protein
MIFYINQCKNIVHFQFRALDYEENRKCKEWRIVRKTNVFENSMLRRKENQVFKLRIMMEAVGLFFFFTLVKATMFEWRCGRGNGKTPLKRLLSLLYGYESIILQWLWIKHGIDIIP